MKKLTSIILSLLMVSGYLLYPVPSVQAATGEPVLQKAHATAYCNHGIMKSGQQTRAGVCAGANKYQNCVIVMYQRLPDGSVGEYIGMYECLDTGGTDGLKNGTVIDVWQPDLDACQDFMDRVYENDCKGKIYIQIIEGEG